MAKLGAYYGLCPLIDQRNLLGISEDVDAGHVIVTLGKNIAIKYKLSDQKQINSWRTKDKFSSPIIYDKENQNYVAVFNQNYVRLWNKDEEHLDKLKKYKFSKPIYTILNCNEKAYVVFKNGTISALNWAIENRKEFVPKDIVDASTEYIADLLHVMLHDQQYIGLLVVAKESSVFMWTTVFNNEQNFQKIVLERPGTGIALVGQVLNLSANQEDVQLFSLWSDGRLYSYIVSDSSGPSPKENQTASPGTVYGIIESLSCKDNVTMVSLNHHYIAMYGADCNQEGATLIIYNTQFKITQSRQPLKLFSSGAKLWQIENNLLLCVGQNLAVIPFRLETEHLAALVGSHKMALADQDPDVAIVDELEVADWGHVDGGVNGVQNFIPEAIQQQVLELSGQGLPETTICEKLIPEFIANVDVQAITNCLEYFCDIPESCIAKLLNFTLSADSKLFQPTKVIYLNSFPERLQPLQRCMLLDDILKVSFSDVLLLPYLRSDLDLSNALLILEYLCYLLSDEGHTLPLLGDTESEGKIVSWGCLLLDANYQKILLSRDTKILEVLTCFKKLVSEHLSCLEELRAVAPILRQVQRGKLVDKSKYNVNLKYSVEELRLC